MNEVRMILKTTDVDYDDSSCAVSYEVFSGKFPSVEEALLFHARHHRFCYGHIETLDGFHIRNVDVEQ